jgi:hypothetical protein
MGWPYIAMMMGQGGSSGNVEPTAETYPCGVAWRRHCLVHERCIGPARARRLRDQKRGAVDSRRGGSMARSLGLGLGLGRSGCSGFGHRRFGRWGARCALILRLRLVLPTTLLSRSGALRTTAIRRRRLIIRRPHPAILRRHRGILRPGIWLSSTNARPCRAPQA